MSDKPRCTGEIVFGKAREITGFSDREIQQFAADIVEEARSGKLDDLILLIAQSVEINDKKKPSC